MTDRDDAYLRNIEERAHVHLEKISKGLRDMADAIDRAAAEKSRSLDRISINTVHEVTWGVANLNLDGLMSTVSDWHEAKDALRTINETE